MKKYFASYNTPLGECWLLGDEEGLNRIFIETPKGKGQFLIEEAWERNDTFFSSAVDQLGEYFEGKRSCFNLSLAPEGTPFQRRVWDELLKIPYGSCKTYGGIAAVLGRPGASRAVGAAIGKNPLPILVPCHRVIGAGGELTGFAFGLDIKKKLLDLEVQGRIIQ